MDWIGTALNENAGETQRILLSILTGHYNVRAIRINARLHSEKVSTSLDQLADCGLITVNKKDWKTGKSKFCSITPAGKKWLLDNSLNETFQVLSEIVLQLRNTDTRQVFQKVTAERYSQNTKIIRDHFIERMIKADKSPYENSNGLDSTDFDQPFREALKKILALHLFLMPSVSAKYEDPETTIDKDFIFFAPKMRFTFSWHPGAFPDLERELQKVDNYLRNESEKSNRPDEAKSSSKETHLLGLDNVNEEIYKEYVNATNEARRKKILAKIEDQVCWSVGKYLKELSKGKDVEIAKYIDEKQRPFLRKFISLFDN